MCGVITVDKWAGHSIAVQQDFTRTYRDRDGHRHIHGANLGVSAAAYVAVGGFRPLASNEDVALVEALVAAKATVAWSAATRVVTNARLDFRAPQGFVATLRAVSLQARWLDEPANDALPPSCERDTEAHGR